jgi:hypothetical protein
MIAFGPFCIAHFLVVAGKCFVRSNHNFLQADWFRRYGGTCRTTREIDELNVPITQKRVTPIVLYLLHAHFLIHRQALACPKSCLKDGGIPEVSVFLQLAAMVPIGRHAFKY